MNTRLLSVLVFLFTMTFVFSSKAQEHDHTDSKNKVEAELIWNKIISDDIIKQKVQQTGLYSKSELELLFCFFNQRYAQDRFYYFSKVYKEKERQQLEKYCDSLLNVYVSVFESYNLHKATYLKEGQKIYNLQHSFSAKPLEINGPCANIDFEEGTTNGWTGSVGMACSSSPKPCSPVVGFSATKHAIQTGGYDPIVGGNILPMLAPGGNYSLRLEDYETGRGASSISQTFLVTAANSNFTIRYAVVLEDPGDHADADRPYFNVSMVDESGNSMSCAEYRVIAKPPVTNFTYITGTDGYQYLYRNWTTVSIPLNAYVGQNVTITFDVSDCALGAHKGYAYLDGSCLPFQIQSEYQAICNSAPVTLYGPDGYATYQWSGTGITGPVDQQNVIVNQAGTYNLTIGSVTGVGCSSDLSVVLTSDAHTFAGNDTSVCEGNSVQLRATGVGPDVVWSPSTGLNNPNISNPIATPLVTTTYTVTSCGVSDQVTVVVVDGYTIAVSPDITLCTTTSTVLTATPDEAGTFSYRWSPALGLSSANVNSPVASPTDPVTYTVTVTRIDGCTRTGDVTVTINNPIAHLYLTAWPEITCSGDPVEIGAGEIVLEDNCDVLNTTAWNISGGGGSSACGSISGNSYFFNGNSTRSLTSRDWLDLSSGGTISFYLKISTGTGACEDTDQGEDVVLEYTVDGITWVNMQTFNEADYPFFTFVGFPTPAVARFSAIKFRIRQLSYTTGGQDTWSIDNIKIAKGLVQTGNQSGISYAWSPVTELLGYDNTSASAQPTITTTYSLTINNAVTGCNYTASRLVTVAPAFSLSLPSPVNICRGASTILSAALTPSAGSYEYYWHNSNYITPRFSSSATVNPPVTTTYTLSVKSAQGCVRRTDSEVRVIQAPTLKANTSLNPICGSQAAELSATDILVSDTIQSALNATRWTSTGATVSSACGSVSGNAVTFDGNGTRALVTNVSYNTSTGGFVEFYLKISDGTGSCDDAETSEDVVLEYSYNSGWAVMATFNEADYPDFTYVHVAMPVDAQSTNTAFRWRQLQNSGVNQDVWAIDNIIISRNLFPDYTYDYTWSPSASLDNGIAANPMATPATDTWYTLELLTEGMCPKKDSVQVRVVPDFSLTIDNQTLTTCINATTILNAQTDLPAGGYTALWSPATGLDDPRVLAPELTAVDTATYNLVVVSAAGCRKGLSVDVIPQGISPSLILTASKTLVCSGTLVNLNAQVISSSCGTFGVCTGTSTSVVEIGNSTGGTSPLPFTGSYKDSRTQLLFNKTELLSMGFKPGDIIKSVAFEIFLKQSTIPYSNFSIRMGCTSLTSLGNTYVTGNTEVYTPKSVTTTIGWNTFTLDHSFMWNGNSNLIIEICYHNDNTSYHDYVTSVNTSFNSSVYGYNNFSPVPGCEIISGNASTSRPVVRLASCAGTVPNSSFTWTPEEDLSNPNILNPVATVNETTTYTIQVTTPDGCVTTKSKTINVEDSDINVWADTTCLNGAPVPVHAIFPNTPIYNCNTIPTLPSTTPYTVQVGTITPGNTSFMPLYGGRENMRTQMVIPASELWSAGITKGAINSIGFNIEQKNSTQPYQRYTIRLGCTSLTTFPPDPIAFEPTIEVYSPRSYTSTLGMNVFVFDNAYAWDGVSNLIVEISWDNGSSITDSDYASCYGTPYLATLYNEVDLNAAVNLIAQRTVMFFNVYTPDAVIGNPPALTYQWSTHSGTLANPANANTTVTTTTNTWAVFTLSGGLCTVKDSVYIRPNQIPNIHIDSTLNCITGEFTFTSNASGFAAHQWTPAVTGNPSDFSVIPLSDYYYILNVTNDLLCENKDSVLVKTGGDLIVPEDTILCEGFDITFTAQGGDNYVWQLPGQTVTGPDYVSFTNVEEPVSLSLVITRHNGCVVTNNWTLGIMDSLDISISSDRPHACLGLPTHLTASGGDNYQWSPSSLFTGNGEVQNISITTDTEIKVESSNRCFTDSAKVMLVVYDIPVIAKAADTTICYATPVQLHATYDPSYQYSWSPAPGLNNAAIFNPVASPVSTTTYFVDVSNGFCSAYDTVLVTVLDQLHAEINASAVEGDIPFSSTLTSNTTASSYSWYTHSNPAPFASTQQTSYQILTASDAVVYLEITNAAGCRAIDSVYLLASYIFIPNLVTPNGDGDNDTYKLVLFGHEWSILIVNRWGEQVYKNDNYHNEWGADDVSDGMYYYEVVEKRSNRTYKGWVHVMTRKE